MRLTPEMFDAGRVEAGDPRSDAGIGGMADIGAVVLDPSLLGAPAAAGAAAPCEPCCIGVELGEAEEEAEPAANGISGYCVWALKTMLRFVLGGMRRADALRYT